MEAELTEIKGKILEFCNKYNVKDFKVEIVDSIINVYGKPITNDISIKIEV